MLPIAVAVDYGGILWWTQSLSAIAVMAAVILAIPGIFAPGNMRLMRQHGLLLPVVLFVAYAWIQVIPLPSSIVGLLSPGSQTAYSDWISPFVPAEELPSQFPVSVAADSTMHAASFAMVIIGVLWAASQVFFTRLQIAILLSVVALGAGAHAAFGFLRLAYPDILAMVSAPGPSSFGSFYNRSNAAFMMNLGLAASLGLLSWRLSALWGMEVDDPHFQLSDLVALVSDRLSIVGGIGLVLCLGGLLVCGSRGGLVGCLLGFVLSFGWIRQRRGFQTVPIAVFVGLIGLGFLFVPLNLSLESLKRFDVFTSEDTSTLIRSGRLDHWNDGWDTAVAHLPAGSGLSTYAYAYLPHQESSPPRWYYHADNLWLEMFTEMGIVGLVLTIWLFVIWAKSLRTLGDSPDAMDQCLRVTGWYMFAVVIVTQFFDFGLILPANLIMFSVLVAATVSRGAVVGVTGGPMVFRSRKDTIASLLVGGFAILVTGFGVYRLNVDAHVESLAFRGAAAMKVSRGDADILSEYLSKIEKQIDVTGSATLWNTRSDLLYQQIRLAELSSARPQTPEEAKEIYRSSAPAKRRIAYQGPNAVRNISTQSNADDYQEVLRGSNESLRRLPLGLQARNWQMYLDFVHGDSERSKIAIEQMRVLYQRNPKMLIRLGDFAADLGEYETAKTIWRDSIEQDFLGTNDVVQRADQHDQVDIADVLPDTPEVARQVAALFIQYGDIRKELLTKLLGRLHCETCQSNSEKAYCERLAGDVSYAIGKYDESFAHYETALQLTPTDNRMHKTFIVKLREQGKQDEALKAAKIARKIFPSDSTFTVAIQKMAADDLKRLESK